jgi:hypothetical protein
MTSYFPAIAHRFSFDGSTSSSSKTSKFHVAIVFSASSAASTYSRLDAAGLRLLVRDAELRDETVDEFVARHLERRVPGARPAEQTVFSSSSSVTVFPSPVYPATTYSDPRRRRERNEYAATDARVFVRRRVHPLRVERSASLRPVRTFEPTRASSGSRRRPSRTSRARRRSASRSSRLTLNVRERPEKSRFTDVSRTIVAKCGAFASPGRAAASSWRRTTIRRRPRACSGRASLPAAGVRSSSCVTAIASGAIEFDARRPTASKIFPCESR